MTDFLGYLNSEKRPILVFDGATGTSLQDQQLNADDYGGASLEGCNENLVLTSVKSVEKVHESFLEAGCDVIETNTFGATSIVLDEYGIGDCGVMVIGVMTRRMGLWMEIVWWCSHEGQLI